MNYAHEFEAMGPANSGLAECQLCGYQCTEVSPNSVILQSRPCPEKIVREVVRRLHAELQQAQILPAKRKDRQRP